MGENYDIYCEWIMMFWRRKRYFTIDLGFYPMAQPFIQCSNHILERLMMQHLLQLTVSDRCLPMNLKPDDLAGDERKDRQKIGSSLADVDPMTIDTSVSIQSRRLGRI